MRRIRATVLAAALAASTLAPATTAQAVTTNDTLVEHLWGLDQINVEAGWLETTGEGITVAVVDSGVDLDHPDLAANLLPGITFSRCTDEQLLELTGCGDGNWLTPEFGDTIANSSLDADHGTHVAGTIAALRDNGIGVSGVAPDASILPVKVLDNEGSGNNAEIAAGIRWAVRNGADVINMSLGKNPGLDLVEGTVLASSIESAIDEAVANGVVVVVAAGNLPYPMCSSPASFDGTICVTATGYFGEPSWYSDGAIKDDQMSVAAPGGSNVGACDGDILSTVPDEIPDTTYCAEPTGGYESKAGTSMATPHVSGVVAQLLSLGCDAREVHALLRETSFTPTWGPGLWTPEYGWGIVDLEEAIPVAKARCTPPAPVNTAPTAADDASSTARNTPVTIDVLTNDVDAEGDALTVTAVEGTTGAVVNGDGTLTWTPPKNFTGVMVFTYAISDGEFESTAHVTVDVTRK